MKWRNLYLKPESVLLKIANRLSVKTLVDSDMDTLWVKSTENIYYRILDEYHKKKGIVQVDKYGRKGVSIKFG